MITDPIEADPQVLIDRQDEAIREQRWAEFVIMVDHARIPTLLRHIADLMDGQRDPYYGTVVIAPLLAFADSEGWHGVLSAIAKAMRESGQ